MDALDGIIDARKMGLRNKPEEDAYRISMQVANEKEAEKCILFDESYGNAQGAHAYGMNAAHALSRPEHQKVELECKPPFGVAPAKAKSLHDLPSALLVLLKREERYGDRRA